MTYTGKWGSPPHPVGRNGSATLICLASKEDVELVAKEFLQLNVGFPASLVNGIAFHRIPTVTEAIRPIFPGRILFDAVGIGLQAGNHKLSRRLFRPQFQRSGFAKLLSLTMPTKVIIVCINPFVVEIAVLFLPSKSHKHRGIESLVAVGQHHLPGKTFLVTLDKLSNRNSDVVLSNKIADMHELDPITWTGKIYQNATGFQIFNLITLLKSRNLPLLRTTFIAALHPLAYPVGCWVTLCMLLTNHISHPMVSQLAKPSIVSFQPQSNRVSAIAQFSFVVCIHSNRICKEGQEVNLKMSPGPRLHFHGRASLTQPLQ